LAFEDEGGATIAGNSDAVQFALRNLIDNAIRHSPPGETVRVIAGPGAQLQVVDRGKGIPRHMRDRIFQRFWRGSHSEGAAGLGLAIVKHVADAHGASIAIDDAAAGGTHIRLIFSAAANIGIGIKAHQASPATLATGNPTLASG
jgi:signal transduction histidine kinase